MRCRAARLLGLVAAFAAGPASAALVAPPPGQDVVMLEEHVLLVFDPLTGTQTMLIDHVFEGTATPFGIIIPTPAPAQVSTPSDRLRQAVQARLHPLGKVRRTLDVELVSWARGCALRPVGDGVGETQAERGGAGTSVQATSLGMAPEPMHEWLLAHGFTLAPAQAAWLTELTAQGWSLVGVVVRPPAGGATPPPRLQGPVLAITHEAQRPIYAGGHPPFAIDARGRPAPPPLEVGVLTEWAVNLDAEAQPEPFFADALSSADVGRLGSEAGGLPWAFRRDGTLTAFRLERPPGAGILQFSRTDPRPPLRPEPRPQIRAHRLKIPVEAFLLAVVGAVWLWLRFGRGGDRGGGRLRRLG